ncbi:MAG: hypothetical protein FWB94_00275 [Chitinispirillia bacterium]|nr:hypothetical protein [Chitinispirillia bacterium]
MSYFAAIISGILLTALAGGAWAGGGASPLVPVREQKTPSSSWMMIRADSSQVIPADSGQTVHAVSGQAAGADTVLSNSGITADDGDNGAQANSTGVTDIRDTSSTRIERQRITTYDPARPDSARAFNPSQHTAADLFRSDGASPAEMLRYRELTSVYLPFTLSGAMNRILTYGNPVPDEYASFQRTDYFYHPYPNDMTGPELLIFWENGVFNQNTLNLRLVRPLSANIMMSLFSNYRYLRGQRFNHEGNDIVKFYEFFHYDTSTIMNYGYNPHTEEHMMGGSFMWSGADSSKMHASFSFSNLQNEYALNIPAPSTDRLEWALLERRLFRADAELLEKTLSRRWRTNIKTAFISESDSSFYRGAAAGANGSGSSNNFIIDADFYMINNLGVNVSGMLRDIEDYNGGEYFLQHYSAELFYTRYFGRKHSANGKTNIKLHARLGTILLPNGDTPTITDNSGGQQVAGGDGIAYVSPKAAAGFEWTASDSNARFRAYVKLDPRPFYAGYDTLRYGDYPYPFWYGNDGAAGAEGWMRWGYLGLLLGAEMNTAANVRPAWPQGYPPYVQPGSSFIIAPWVSRYQGFSLLSRFIITDTKPRLKASANLSYIIQPKWMEYTFEPELGFDYWSERDPFYFAGHTAWHHPVYDLNMKITAHIRSFRLFYKVDNLLNLKQAYVPGYFSPGLTFRWGLNWFI